MEPTLNLETRDGPKVVYKLGAGRYLSGCRRFLIERRDLGGELELYEHRGYTRRPVALTRRKRGWTVFDLERGMRGYDPERRVEVVRAPFEVWLSGHAKTLRETVACLPQALERVEKLERQGSLVPVPPIAP